MTREQRIEQACVKFQGQLLLFITEAWAVRKLGHKELAMVIDEQHVRGKQLLRDIIEFMTPPASTNEPPKPTANGHANGAANGHAAQTVRRN